MNVLIDRIERRKKSSSGKNGSMRRSPPKAQRADEGPERDEAMRDANGKTGSAPIRDERLAELEGDNELLRRAVAEARAALSKRDRFLAALSHELRNPLAAILSAVHLMERGSANAEAAPRALQTIRRQAEHMSRLLNDLLDVARVIGGKIDFRQEQVDLRQLAADAVEATQSSISARGQSLLVHTPKQPAVVEGDAVRLLQIIDNLLTNASKYTPDGGQIRLAVEIDGRDCLVRVQDTGWGIEPHMLEKIFDMFVQADSTRERRCGGMGIGLTLVRSLVEMHGGSVTASSDGRGRGSEFVVRLPRCTSSREQNDEVRPTTHHSITKIVIVEDNADARSMLQMLLELDGYQVVAVENGQEGIDEILDGRPDLALVDIGLPVIDGYEVARRVRQSPTGQDILLVAITGFGQADDRRRVKRAGFDEHLVKPISPDDLSRVLRLAAKPRIGRIG